MCCRGCPAGSAVGLTCLPTSGRSIPADPCGDVDALTAALTRALARARDPQLGRELCRRVAGYSSGATVVGFEQATAAAVTANNAR